MKITKHAQSCFLIETLGKRILIDLGTFVFDKEGLSPSDFIDIDIMIFTHDHSDHFDWERAQELIEAERPVVLGTNAVCDIIKEKFSDLDARAISDIKHNFGDVQIEGYVSRHGPLPSGKPAPGVSGVVIDDGAIRFYHPGDTITLNPDSNPDVVATPISGTVTTNIEEAKKQLLLLKPKLAIPMHYDGPKYPTDVNEFARAMSDTQIVVKILESGESVEI